MTYKAVVTPRPPDGGVASICSGGCGAPVETVDFALDGAPIADCLLRPVDLETGVATCTTSTAPAAGGKHTVTASYVGNDDTFLTTSQGTDDFEVTAPGISTSTSALAFGSVTVGATGTQQVTVTNTGTRALSLGAAAVSGPFTIASSTCGETLAPGGSCVITLAFAPAAAGGANGTLTIASDAGSPAVALTATGVAATTAADRRLAAAERQDDLHRHDAGPRRPEHGHHAAALPERRRLHARRHGRHRDRRPAQEQDRPRRGVATQTVARFSGVRVAAGKVKAIKLKLSPAFIKAAQKRGIRLHPRDADRQYDLHRRHQGHASRARRDPHPEGGRQEAAAPTQAPRFTG